MKQNNCSKQAKFSNRLFRRYTLRYQGVSWRIRSCVRHADFDYTKAIESCKQLSKDWIRKDQGPVSEAAVSQMQILLHLGTGYRLDSRSSGAPSSSSTQRHSVQGQIYHISLTSSSGRGTCRERLGQAGKN